MAVSARGRGSAGFPAPVRRLPTDSGVIVGAIGAVGCLFLGLTAAVAGWDGGLGDVISSGPASHAKFGVALIGAALCFVLGTVLTAGLERDAAGELGRIYTDALLIARGLRIQPVVPLLLTVTVFLAIGAAASGSFNPWLWAATADLALGTVLTWFSPSLEESRTHAVASPDNASATRSVPDAMAWWNQLKASPEYHGQIHSQWTLHGREEAVGGDRFGQLQPGAERGIFEALLQGKPVYPHVVETFRTLTALPSPSDPYGPLCVVDLENGAGLSTLVAALAIYNANHRYLRTIVVSNDAAKAQVLAARLAESVRQDARWRGTILVSLIRRQSDLADLSAKAYQNLPHVLIVDPVGLDVVLRRSTEAPWVDFFASLGLVAVLGAYGLVGCAGEHTALLLRRLEAAWRRAGAMPAYLAECIAAAEQGAFLTQLLGRPVRHTVMVKDEASPRRSVTSVAWIPNLMLDPESDQPVCRRSFLDEVEMIAARAVVDGLNTLIVLSHPAVSGSDLTTLRERIAAAQRRLPRQEPGRTPGRFEVVPFAENARLGPVEHDLVVYAGFPKSRAELAHEVALLGTQRGPGGKIAVLVAPHEPSSLFFLRGIDRSGEWGLHSPVPALDLRNSSILDLHLRALVGSGLYTPEELGVLGDVDAKLKLWLRKGTVAYDRETRYGAIRPAKQDVDYFNPKIDVQAAGEAIAKVQQEGSGEALATMDGSRTYRVAYPGALLVYDSLRYQVRSMAIKDSVAIVDVETTALQDRLTHPVSVVTVACPDSSQISAESRSAGGVTMHRCRARVEIAETVIGFRRGSISRPEEPPPVTQYGGNRTYVRPPFYTSAVALAFSGDTSPSTMVLHTLGHLLLATAPLHIRYRSEDLGMTVIDACDWFEGRSGLLLYDDAIDGFGITDRLSSLLSEGALRSCYDLLTACPCAEGCTACIYNPTCKRGLVLDGLDKLATLTLLGQVLGIPEEAEREKLRRSQPITDHRFLAQLATRIVKQMFEPMLDITIGRMPVIVSSTSLPDGVLGRYLGSRNRIEILPAVERQVLGVLAHELAHAWSLQGGFNEERLRDPNLEASNLLFLEGFAQWVEFKVLDYFGFRVEIEEISGRGPDEYGIGFRLFQSLENHPEKGGVLGVLRMVGDPDLDWLRDYFNSPLYLMEVARYEQMVAQSHREPDWERPPGDERAGAAGDPADLGNGEEQSAAG